MDVLEQRLLGKVARASRAWDLLAPDDRILVAMSGGKDSYVLFDLLRTLQARVPFRYELVAVHLDQHQPGFDTAVVARHLAGLGVEHHVLSEDTYSVVVENTPAGKAYCSLCSRLRRGILYTAAQRLGCTKIALGHHRDDSIETLLLNLLYAGQIKAMPPRLVSDDGRNVVIRPLIECAEADIAELARRKAFPVQPCTVCSRQPDLKRAKVKGLLDALDAENPTVRANVFAALANVRPSHLLDRTLVREGEVADAAEALAAVEGSEAGACSLP